MNENYVEDIRQLIYRKTPKNAVNLNKKMPKTDKIKFCHDKYNSEDVFDLIENKSTVTKKKPKNKSDESLTDIFSDRTKSKKIISIKRNKSNKKRKIEIDFSSDDNISPTTSETSDLSPTQKTKFSFKKLWRKTTEDLDQHVFNLDQFFSTSEPSLTETMIDSHSGIDYEFLSTAINNVRIMSCNIYDDISVDNAKFGNGQEDVPLTQARKTNMNDGTNVDVVIHEPTNITEDTTFDNSSLVEKNSCVDTSVAEQQNNTGSDELPVLNNDNQESSDSYQQFNLEHQKLVILKENSSVSCFGVCSLKVLHGTLEILGATLNKTSKEVNLYSPRGSALLVIKNTTEDNDESDFKDIQPILDSTENFKNFVLEKNSGIFICSKIEDSKITFIEKYIPQQIFPKIENSRTVQIIFDPKEKYNITLINPEWDRVMKFITRSTKLLIAGGKGVGKSTFVRYIVNKLVNRFEKVRIIDVDPGQSEFSVPGCISAVTVSDPVFGPNYTHLHRIDRSYLSNINVGSNPRKYLETIQYLIGSTNFEEDLPTIINYMGFSTGIGLNIISSAITYIKPTDIVQIDSKSSKKNFKSDLNFRTVRENCKLFGGNANHVSFNLIKVSSMTDGNKGWSLEPRQVREMCVLAYFGELMNDGATSLTSSLPMFK